jgi:hypothetical protein
VKPEQASKDATAGKNGNRRGGSATLGLVAGVWKNPREIRSRDINKIVPF